MDDEQLDQRATVLREVVSAPGAGTRELAARLGVTEWTVDYHLRRLKRSGAVIDGENGRSRSWYATSCGFCPVLRGAMPALRRPETLAVARSANDLPASLPEMATRAGVSLGAARWSVGVLTGSLILERTRRGRVSLREGASRCILQAEAGKPCTLWGKCPVSQAWSQAARASAPPQGAVWTQAKVEVPERSTSKGLG